MAALLKLVVVGTCGVLLGLLLTIASLRQDLRGVSAGPWRAFPREGAVDADPYALATVARAGTLPLASAEGLRFTAAVDSGGTPLSPSCTYKVSGPIPPARFWTLGVLTPEGFPIANAAARYAVTSAEILRQTDEPVAITVAGRARSGNWLPLAEGVPFVLSLHLYDTGLSAAGSSIGAGGLPTIAKLACR